MMLFQSDRELEYFINDLEQARDRLQLIDDVNSIYCAMTSLVGYFAEFHSNCPERDLEQVIRAYFLELMDSYRAMSIPETMTAILNILDLANEHQESVVLPEDSASDDDEDDEECCYCDSHDVARRYAESRFKATHELNSKLMAALVVISKSTSLKKMKRLSRKALEQYGASSNV